MKKRMHLMRAILGLGIALATLVGMAGIVRADPMIPETFWGTVTIDGSPAPDGITIEARDSGGGFLGSTTTLGGGFYSMSFSAPEDGDPLPPNPPIHFWIDPDGAGPSPRYEADNNPCTTWTPEAVNNWNVTGSSTATAVRIASFEAKATARSVMLGWATGCEIDNLGFNVYRAEGQAGRPGTPLNRDLILSQSPGSMRGAQYYFVDDDVDPGTTYRYWLEDVDMAGKTTMHGPVTATIPGNANAGPTNVSVTPGTRPASPGPGPSST